MTTPVLSVVGYANSGKTTFLEGMIPFLRQEKIRVAVFKHHGHNDDAGEDVKGKDTYRLAAAGGAPVGLVRGRRVTLYHTLAKEPEPQDLRSLAPGVDLIITEGFKGASNPKIEIWRHPDQEQPACTGDANLIAVVTGHISSLQIPTFKLDEYQKVATFIIRYFQLKQV